MHSYTEENYLKAIYKLSEHTDQEISTNEIAAMMNTKAASVTDMLRKLSDKNLINYVKYQGVTLTSAGMKVAVSIIRKHRLWEVFLVEKLDFKWDEVHDIAEELEHIGSDELIDRLDTLSECKVGDEASLSGVNDHSSLFLQYLDKLSMKLGTPITVIDFLEYDGSMVIGIPGQERLQISKEVAKNLLVSKR
jgi:DtxR family Mn-dependent transcriptional regulator